MYGELVPIGGGDNIPLQKKELVVGRRNNCDIILRFNNVSGKHCRLVLSHGYWYVQDLKSTNGVKVNGVRVEDRRVDPGSKISIAKHLYTLEYDPSKNGALGAPPPDVLETNVFDRSLMERAGLGRTTRRKKTAPKPTKASQKNNEELKRDYWGLTIDDIEYEDRH